MANEKYEVFIGRKVLKNLKKTPIGIQEKFANLVDDLKDKGPYRSDWPNYGRLRKSEYHCHLSHHWVACWRFEKNRFYIEVYYAGSRENAPY